MEKDNQTDRARPSRRSFVAPQGPRARSRWITTATVAAVLAALCAPIPATADPVADPTGDPDAPVSQESGIVTSDDGTTPEHVATPTVLDVRDPELADKPKVVIEGSVVAFPVETSARKARADRTAGDTGDAVHYRVLTADGAYVPITTAGLAGADAPSTAEPGAEASVPQAPAMQTGSMFRGTAAIPDRVMAELSHAHAVKASDAVTVPLAAGTSAGTEVIQAAAALDEPLPVASARIENTKVEAVTSTAHVLDVAVVRPWGDVSVGNDFYTKAEVTALVKQLAGYWKPQSNGIVKDITVRAFKQYTSVYDGWDGCDPYNLWDEAAWTFGKDKYTIGQGEHLVVLSPPSCNGGTGLASVGEKGLASGGIIWAAVDGTTDLHTIGHEFGHNLGLMHANVHMCPGGIIEGMWKSGAFTDKCYDDEYFDFFDMMSGGMELNDWGTGKTVATSTLTALNAPSRKKLGLYRSGELKSVALATGKTHGTASYSIAAASATTGLRGLKVTDPRSGEVYYVEFRSGTGVDKGAFYTASGIEWAQEAGVIDGMGVGVRVLRMRDDDTTSVLRAAEIGKQGFRNLFLGAGHSLAVRGGGTTFTVTKLAEETATVRVDLAAPGAGIAVDRISGDDRYATAVAIAKSGYPGAGPLNVPVVYLATGQDYPDALAAAPAAVAKGGPLLLTMTKKLPSVVAAELKRLKPAKIVVVGGKGAVSNAVVTELKKLAPKVVRLGGADRFETSRLIIADAFGRADAAYVATGLNYPDALSASAAGGALGYPVVLVDGRKGKKLDKASTALLKNLRVSKAYIAGGTGVVNKDIQTALKEKLGLGVKRFAGSDRFETSQLINKAAFPKPTRAYVATGMQFPDALAGAVLAGAQSAPLYVVMPKCLPRGVADDIDVSGMTRMTLLGGTGALTKAVQKFTRC